MSNPNILLVCIDCLRGDFVGTEHADTPFIDSLADEGIHYRDMYATTTTTTPSVASFMTGSYSERNGVYSLKSARLADDVPTLAEYFSKAGYSTRAMVTGPLIAKTDLDRGFDVFEYRDPNEQLVGDWFNVAVNGLHALEPPFFLYLHLWELHLPITVPQSFDTETFGRYPYARILSALDRSLESFCKHLPDETAIGLLGDHGEAIAYRDSRLHTLARILRTGIRYGLGIDTRRLERYLKKRFARSLEIDDHFMEDGHGENVFDFVSRVPFVLSWPELGPATVDAQVRQVDVLPTLLTLAGLDAGENQEMDGRSLLPPDSLDDRDVYVRACGKSLIRDDNWHRAIRANGMKYVEYPNRGWEYELYDLRTDPEELDPITDDRAASRLRSRIPERQIRSGDKLEIDELLRDLGYK